MNIYVFEATAEEEQFLRDRLGGNDVRFVGEPLTSLDQLGDGRDWVEAISVFVHSKVSGDIIHNLPNLKLIVTRSTGFNHIDTDAAHQRSLTVSNVPSYGEHTVAEHAFALLLSLTRKVHQAYLRSTRGDFSLDGLRGVDLAGKTLGVVGAGRIGQKSIAIGKGLGMEVVAFDVYENHEAAERLGYRYVSLDELLGMSDAVTMHAPATPENYHLINLGNIDRFKRGSYLINTARGELIEPEAILAGLERGTLAGVGLDVFEQEALLGMGDPLLSTQYKDLDPQVARVALINYKIVTHPNVLATPHMAFDTKEAVERILQTSVDDIIAFQNGNAANVI